MSILIVGKGVVGLATARLFKQDFVIHYFDIDSPLTALSKNYEFIFICVPTPMGDDGRLNTDIVENSIHTFRSFSNNIIVRSTVPVGFCDKYDVDFFPEFLVEADPEKSSRLIFGGDVKLPLNNVFYCTRTEAEMIKLASNAYLSMRLAYFHELKTHIVNHLPDVDFNTVKNGICSDERIGFLYAEEPFEIKGKCLPKDLSEFAKGLDSPLFTAINDVARQQQ